MERKNIIADMGCKQSANWDNQIIGGPEDLTSVQADHVNWFDDTYEGVAVPCRTIFFLNRSTRRL